MTEPPQIASSTPGSFPWSVLHDRHPALIEKVRHGLPYPPAASRALTALAEEIEDGIRPLPATAHDHDRWAQWGGDHFGKSWYDVPFLWAESYFYRKLLEAVGYFRPGPWRGIDLFEPFKAEELHGDALARDLAALDEEVSRTDEAVLTAALWGNRADLGFQLSAREGAGEAVGALVADDSARLWSLLDSRSPGTVCVVADNAARELVPDLVLADHLLATGRAAAVTLQVKPYPYYVSDATIADVLAALRRLRAAPGRAGEIGARLWRAMGEGFLTVRAHWFWCSPWSHHELPADLADELAGARLTIMKGDLNYRRLVGDREWQATTPFADTTAYFPGPVAALRTLKSDVVVGLDEQTVTRLDATGTPWRTDGTHALVQVR